MTSRTTLKQKGIRTMTHSLRTIAFLLMLLGLTACGGGGGGGNSSGGGGGTTPSTYMVTITDIDMIDTRTAQSVDAVGLPIAGATVTRN
jgi:hypothetical protein